jgi:hypothetical protein
VLPEREHKRFSPSRSERFIPCRGSVNLIERSTPRPDTAWAREGRIAHEILEAGLKNNAKTATEAQGYSAFKGQDLTPHIRSSIVEFKASINDALDYVWGKLEELQLYYDDVVLFVEVQVDPPVASAPGEAAGFCDIAIYSAKARRLWVIDYKHGAGIAKAVVGNTQVTQYAAGFLYDAKQYVDPASVDIVTLVIIQPRAFHKDGDIREYEVTPQYVKEYLAYLDGVIADALRPDAPLNPGEEQCRFCDARDKCPAAQSLALSVVNKQFINVGDVAAPKMPDPKALDMQRLAYIKSMRSFVESWFDACDDALKDNIMKGQPGHGYKAVEAHAQREYDAAAYPEPERVKALASLVGCNDWELYNVKLKPLTEMEMLVKDAFKRRAGHGRKKKAAEEAAQMFAYFTIKRSSGTLTIVEDSDPRPPANLAAKFYSQLPEIAPPPTTEGKVK